MKVLRPKSKTLQELLPRDAMEMLTAAGVSRTFEDGQIIQDRGDRQPGLSIVISGEVVAGNVGRDGSFLTSAVLRAGETFGEYTLFAGSPRTHTLWSQGNATITFVNADAFTTLFDSEPAIARALLTLTLQRNYEMMDFIDAQRRFSLKARVARLLLATVDSSESRCSITCRQEDLAFMLGVSRVATGKALKRLKDDGFLFLKYGRIDIPNVRALREMIANEDQFFPVEND